MNIKKIAAVIVILFWGIAMTTDFFSNLWCLLTARGFIIPKESSVFSFKTTVMNEGSGEWWIYGEDNNYFYYFTGEEITPYLKMPKSKQAECKNFDPLNHETWC